jgi:hypothetical protein
MGYSNLANLISGTFTKRPVSNLKLGVRVHRRFDIIPTLTPRDYNMLHNSGIEADSASENLQLSLFQRARRKYNCFRLDRAGHSVKINSFRKAW